MSRTADPERVLAGNGGSSSIKIAVVAADGARVATGQVDRVGQAGTTLRAGAVERPLAGSGPADVVSQLLDWLEAGGHLVGVAAVGHRIVHGGPDHVKPEVLTPAVLADLRRIAPIDPQHLPGEIALVPDEIALVEAIARVIGDGEVETGPLATSWHSNKFLDPARDGAVLPILHQNGYTIANPCFLARIPKGELRKLFEGYGYSPHIVEGHEPDQMHQAFAGALDTCAAEVRRIQQAAHTNGSQGRPAGLADDRPPHAHGGGPARPRSTASRSRTRGAATRCRWATWRPTSTCASWNGG